MVRHYRKWDHPRLRGEYIYEDMDTAREQGSPPLARGIHFPFICVGRESGITPACAGNTGKNTDQGGGYRDHPRLRGEYYEVYKKYVNDEGSPPLARGIPQSWKYRPACRGITPACAGNTKVSTMRRKKQGDHPRLRGEYLLRQLRRWE